MLLNGKVLPRKSKTTETERENKSREEKSESKPGMSRRKREKELSGISNWKNSKEVEKNKKPGCVMDSVCPPLSTLNTALSV